MPIYEFRCGACRQVTSVFVRSAGARLSARCEHCHSKKLTRVISKTSHVKTEADVLQQMDAPRGPQRPQDLKDPREIGRWVEGRMRQAGMEIPQPLRDKIDRARAGDFSGPVKDL